MTNTLLKLLISFLLLACATNNPQTILKPGAKEINLTKTVPSEFCFPIGPINSTAKGELSINQVITDLKNRAFDKGGNHIVLKQLETRREGHWAYAEGAIFDCDINPKNYSRRD